MLPFLYTPALLFIPGLRVHVHLSALFVQCQSQSVWAAHEFCSVVGPPMSQQTWPLSQDANKNSGLCSICRATRQLHNKDGTVHKHGPRDNPCPGSNKPPLSTSQTLPGPSGQSQQSVLPTDSQPVPAAHSSSNTQQSVSWSPASSPLIKHIPKSARPTCASHLAKLLRGVTAQPSVAKNWLAVLKWGSSILAVPKRAGKRHNVTSVIKKRIASFPDSVVHDQVTSTQSRDKPASSLLAQAVSAKLEDGNLRAAIRIICSDDSPAQPSRESAQKLQEKHPPASGGLDDLPAINPDKVLAVTETEVRQAVLSFPAGSSGGPDGMRPQHLKDMLLCQESGTDFLAALTGFTNTVLAGLCPKDMKPYFFGGRLLALNKKSGGIRPIAVGVTLRRLASKCANTYGAARMASLFGPRQLGVGIKGGCDAAIHSARRYLQTLPPDHIMVKLDFTNAFNSLHRSDMLLSISDHLPELYAFCLSSYAQPSFLYFGSYVIMSEEGPQQGDPLGPLLFCTTIHPLISSLGSDLTLGYLDDLTLAGPQSVVATDIQQVITEGSKMGLCLNSSKCEVISHPDSNFADPTISSFIFVNVADATLLGAPLFPGKILDDTWLARCEDLKRAADRLSLLSAQDALLLLRVSFSAPRVQHLLRCSPSVDNPALELFDGHLRSALSRISNTSISDTQWLQASLPIRYGGLGIRQVRSLALPAFLASAASTSDLQSQILSASACTTDIHFDSYLSVWQAAHGSLPPSNPLPDKQTFWDRPGILLSRAALESAISDPHEKARLLASVAPHSGDWLLALPVTSCGLRLTDDAVRVAVALRLGCSVCVAHTCRCGALVDTQGLHGLVCKQAPSKIARHQAINDIVARAISTSGTPVMKEPVGLTRLDGKRPDGLTLIPWQGGKSLTWDVTVVSTLADSYLHVTSHSAGGAAETASVRKETKYSALPSDYLFQPIAFENLGPVNASGLDFLNEVGRRLSASSQDPRETSFLFQRLSILIQRYNSVLILESFCSDEDPDL